MPLQAVEISSPVSDLLLRYRRVRQFTEAICAPLATEDYVIQSMPDVSPTRWHIAHTTWFFETFVLKQADPAYAPPSDAFEVLFNSYYNTVGEQFPRARRGLLSRPTVEEVFAYRRHVDERMGSFLAQADDEGDAELLGVVELGLQHEQQHQELMLTDIKHVLSCNPLFPAYDDLSGGRTDRRSVLPPDDGLQTRPTSLKWHRYDQQLTEIGHAGDGFAFDNESPRHKVFIEDFELADRLVTNAEYLQFIEDGGYETPQLWLSEGWATVQENNWQHPLYWHQSDGQRMQFSLYGSMPLNPDEPVCHVSYFEADAFARWAGARLPREAEWEFAATELPITGQFADSGVFHPLPSDDAKRPDEPRQMFGTLWQWTASQYTAYPGYAPPPGALGEYNGKFMCNQFVLRGGSCATSLSHIRATYRNFFPPQARWQFTGIRLARDIDE